MLKSEESVVVNPYSVWKPSQAELRNAQTVFTAQNREFIAAATSLKAMLPPSLPEVRGFTVVMYMIALAFELYGVVRTSGLWYFVQFRFFWIIKVLTLL